MEVAERLVFRPSEGRATLFSGKNRHCGVRCEGVHVHQYQRMHAMVIYLRNVRSIHEKECFSLHVYSSNV